VNCNDYRRFPTRCTQAQSPLVRVQPANPVDLFGVRKPICFLRRQLLLSFTTGVAEAAKYGMKGFLYVPADRVFATEDMSGHYIRCVIYAPLNWLDQNFFDGPCPVGDIMFHLSHRHQHDTPTETPSADAARRIHLLLAP
jgi:hypothetical protein